MTSLFSLDGFLIFSLLVVCCCSYAARVSLLKRAVLGRKHGFRGTFYKAAVLGVRLHYVVSALCVLFGLYRLFF